MNEAPLDPAPLHVPQETKALRAVVTGGSSGIGRATAIELARSRRENTRLVGSDQDRLLITYRSNRSGVDETLQALSSFDIEARAVQADLQLEEDREHLVEQAWSFLGTPSVWINNAGADVLTGEGKDLSFDEKLRLLMEIDVVGTIQLSRLAIERWKRDFGLSKARPQRRDVRDRTEDSGQSDTPIDGNLACMIFVGWDQAEAGMEGDAGQMFGPVKAAIMAFARSLAQDVAPEIRVNTIAPGWIRTAWGQSSDSYWDHRAKSQSLMGRWGNAQDVARAICFAADPRQSFLTGQTILVNGGWNRTFRSS